MSANAATAPRHAATASSRATASKQAASKPGRRNSVWAWVWYGISAGLLAIILGIGIVAIAVPRLTGSVPLTVLTGSMEPGLPPGTMLIVTPLAQNELGRIGVGDVVSYQPYPDDPTLITHRVTAITSLSDGSFVFTTKGDANATADEPVLGKQVRAKLWYAIPGLGWVSDAINGQGNRVWIIPTAAGALFAYAGYTVIDAGVRAARNRKAQAAADAARRGPQ